eukprot:gene42831-8794_t
MDPKKFGTYKIFEKNLTKATDDTPCAEQFTPDGRHYTKYSKTESHGIPGTCTAPLEKYYSVDAPHGGCGEACMDPKKFGTYKMFEKNLTKATDDTPCAEQFTPDGRHYTKYSKTESHGIPGVLSIELD